MGFEFLEAESRILNKAWYLLMLYQLSLEKFRLCFWGVVQVTAEKENQCKTESRIYIQIQIFLTISQSTLDFESLCNTPKLPWKGRIINICLIILALFFFQWPNVSLVIKDDFFPNSTTCWWHSTSQHPHLSSIFTSTRELMFLCSSWRTVKNKVFHGNPVKMTCPHFLM